MTEPEKPRRDDERHPTPDEPVPDRQPPKGPRVDEEDPVEEASYESFPASDPPSFNPGTATGPDD